jgi:hypothetical protein
MAVGRESPLTMKAPEGRYANYFKVGHNAFEFVIDFGQYYPGTDEAELYTRVIMSPHYARDLLNILQQSLVDYETSFGTDLMQ